MSSDFRRPRIPCQAARGNSLQRHRERYGATTETKYSVILKILYKNHSLFCESARYPLHLFSDIKFTILSLSNPR